MQSEPLSTLLTRARGVLERHMFEDSGAMRDDVAEICMAIDDAIGDTAATEKVRAAREPSVLECVAAA